MFEILILVIAGLLELLFIGAIYYFTNLVETVED